MVMQKRRTCGECTACCTALPVGEISKPQGVPCRQCTKVGCSIYQMRPRSCRDFECQWLKGCGEDSQRPDLFGIINDYSLVDGLGYTVIFWEIAKGALDNLFGESTSIAAIEKSIPVLHVYHSRKERLFIPHTLGLSESELKTYANENRKVFIVSAAATN